MKNRNNIWAWVPSLYFAEGIPYVIVVTVSVIMYKRLGISNADISLYTSLLYLPWLIKPIWSPIVDILKSKRWWIISMQLLIAVGFLFVGYFVAMPFFFRITLVAFWLIAFSSATHDIAADGFYMHALNGQQQSFFIGIRSTFYRIAMVFGQGLLIFFAGRLEKNLSSIPKAWSIIFYILFALMALVAIYHTLILPKPDSDKLNIKKNLADVFVEFKTAFISFFKKENIGIAITFMLLYRFAEAFLVKMVPPFLLDKTTVGGLGLETEQVGIVYGTFGTIALVLGGIMGGIVAAKKGLKKVIWMMALSITIPNIVYVYLSIFLPNNFLWINLAVSIEQFGYGFGFTGYMLYLIYFSQGNYKTSHYAICTGFMAAGMMLPGMVAGILQEALGYKIFFIFVMFCCIPTLAIIPFLKIKE